MTSCISTPAWVMYAIDAVLFIAALLAVCVMQKAEKDQQINRFDASWIRKSRRAAFIAIAMFAFMTILTDVSPLAILLLFTSAAILLAIDVAALQQRPPQGGHRTVEHQHRFTAMAPLQHFIAIFRHKT